MRKARQGLAGIAAAVGASLALATPAAAAATAAHVWGTTPDGAMKLSDRGTGPFHHGPSNALTVTVAPSRGSQRMDGFGASIPAWSASVLYRLARRTRNATMRDLFGHDGDRLSFLRQPMGASDFVD